MSSDRPRRAGATSVNYNLEVDDFEDKVMKKPVRARPQVIDSDEEDSAPVPRRYPAAAPDSLASIPIPKKNGLQQFGFAASEKSAAIDAMMQTPRLRPSPELVRKKSSRRMAHGRAQRRSQRTGAVVSYAEDCSSGSSEVDSEPPSIESTESVQADRTGIRASTRTRQAPTRLDASILLESGIKRTVKKGLNRKRSREYSGSESNEDGSSVEDSDGEKYELKASKRADSDKPTDGVEYRIQHVLGSKKLTAEGWRELTADMNSRELNRGSVWEAPDSEYFSNSSVPVEKFLIKWMHASYLHASWELEQDLIDFVGSSAKTALSKYRDRLYCGQELFEDIGAKEYFPPSFLLVERILDVSGDEDLQAVDWEHAVLPPMSSAASIGSFVAGEPMEIDDGTGGESAKKSYLHTPHDCFVTVKWLGLSYRDATFESVNDLVYRGVDYEAPLRAFYRREQSQPSSRPRKMPAVNNIKRTLARELRADQIDEVPKLSGGDLRDYQWESVRWMSFNWSQGRNSILADEMGLGKTIQAAAFLHCLKSYQNIRGPFLVIAPLSTLINWVRELTSWTDLDVVLYHGSQEDRELIREFDFYYLSKPKSVGYKVQVVVTSFETAVNKDFGKGSQRELSNIFWEMLVIDEAHKIKNHASKLNLTLREEYRFRNSLLLTGTPLQNNTDELWSLLNFVDDTVFNSLTSFRNKFGELKEPEQLQALQTQLRPYLLRRIKENVEKSVPPKEELIIEVELTVAQKQYYRAIFEQNRNFLFRGGSKNGPGLSNLAMELRKCCNHPFLVKGAEQALLDHFHKDKPLDVMVDSSGKLVLLDKLLPKLLSGGHKVLIFSQFRIMLDILEDYLLLRGYYYSRIDGAITGRRRQEAIDRFSAPDGNQFVMLLSTRAGGVGINLTTADTVIIFDSDWNPQNDIQAQARAHRIGQKKNVKVYRLLTRKTYEMHLFNVASMKLGLDYALMHNLRSQYGRETTSKKRVLGDDGETAINASENLTKKEIENLLKHGAYDMFREEKEGQSEEASRRFYEEDIDSILQRSTLIVHKSSGADIEEGVDGGAPGAGGALNSFAKASFVSTKEGEINDVAIDDPNFWEKVVGVSNNGNHSSGEEYEDLDGKIAKKKTNRKRRCTRNIGTYKEIGMNFQELKSGDEQSGDSDSADEEKALRRGRNSGGTAVEKHKHIIVLPRAIAAASKIDNKCEDHLDVADYDNIANYLGVYGYGSWDLIAHALEHKYSADQIAKASRSVVLNLFKQAASAPTVAQNPEPSAVLDVVPVVAVSNAKTGKLAMSSGLLVFLYATQMLTDYLVENNLRSRVDIPDEMVLFQWIIDRILRTFSDVDRSQATAAFYAPSPTPAFYVSPACLRQHIADTMHEYCQNVLSDVAVIVPESGFSLEFHHCKIATMLSESEAIPEGSITKLKLAPLEYLFDLLIFTKITDARAHLSDLVSAPIPSGATLVTNQPVGESVEASLLRRAGPLHDFLRMEHQFIQEIAPELHWWTLLHDSLLLLCLYEFGWSWEAYRSFIVPAFCAVSRHLASPDSIDVFADKSLLKPLGKILLKRAKDVINLLKAPAKREIGTWSTSLALKALSIYGIPFSGSIERSSFLPPEGDLMLIADGDKVQIQGNEENGETMATEDMGIEFTDKNIAIEHAWTPYPTTSFISAKPQVDPASRTAAVFGLPPLPLNSWKKMSILSKGDLDPKELEKIACYLLSHETEIKNHPVGESLYANEVLGLVKPKSVRDVLQRIESMWRTQSIMLLKSSVISSNADASIDETAFTSAIGSELCPEHALLATVLSTRMPKLNKWWSGIQDVRLLRIILNCGYDAVALGKFRVFLMTENDVLKFKIGDVPSGPALVNRALALAEMIGRPYEAPIARNPPKLSNAFQKMASTEVSQRVWPMLGSTIPNVQATETASVLSTVPSPPVSNSDVVKQTAPKSDMSISSGTNLIPASSSIGAVASSHVQRIDAQCNAATTTSTHTPQSIDLTVEKADKKPIQKKSQQLSLLTIFGKPKLNSEERSSIRADVRAAIECAGINAQVPHKSSGGGASGLKNVGTVGMSPDSVLVRLDKS